MNVYISILEKLLLVFPDGRIRDAVRDPARVYAPLRAPLGVDVFTITEDGDFSIEKLGHEAMRKVDDRIYLDTELNSGFWEDER
ncbi:MAG: hypothetical protein J6334_02785 [Kiritimatiellae bacterium]|nr:hypothetical protein [Kiritimatiellia bacterium]